jgi:hypothetical protein
LHAPDPELDPFDRNGIFRSDRSGFGGFGGFGGLGGLDRPGLAGLAAQGLVAARLIRARAAARAMGSVILKIPKV